MSNARNLANLLGTGTQITTADIADGAFQANKNLIINGAMQVAQRGTSHATSGYGSLDRWRLALSGGTATMSQESFTIGQTDVPGSEKYLKLAVTTGDNNEGLYYLVEARDLMPVIGGQVTLSYYAKGTSPTDGLDVKIAWYDGSTGSNATPETVTLTSSWVKYTHTFTTPSVTGLNLASSNANARLEISWLQQSTDTGTAAWELNLAQVQLEVGDTATPFEHRSYSDELARCQRYAIKLTEFNGNKMREYDRYRTFSYVLPVEMRATPTVPSMSTTDGATCTIGNATNRGFVVNSVAPGDGYTAYVTSQLVVDAEL